ncbi:MAG: dethiobiotin synthase [Rhodanobacteraceae bacterium]|nr:MAG: dethiobiotin synthase [Rhodanobacteraceae bacterium]
MKPRGVFVTGTDTGIGKTWAACTLLHALRAAGLRATGMKPVASGCAETPEGLRSDDALALIAASDPQPERYEDCNPFAFAPAASPHIAAAEAGHEINLQAIEDAYDTLGMLHGDAIVVEGVGGWLAPLTNAMRASAIPRQLGTPVILVVGLRPGCLSHAQLTVKSIRSNDCELLGWIGNRIDPGFLYPKENLATLHQVLAAPCLGVIGHGVEPPAAAAALREAADAVRDIA